MPKLTLSQAELEKLAEQQLKHRERMKKAQVKRRARLKEQGKVQVSFMVDKSRADDIKKVVKLIQEKGLTTFALCEWAIKRPETDPKPSWWIIFETAKPENGGSKS